MLTPRTRAASSTFWMPRTLTSRPIQGLASMGPARNPATLNTPAAPSNGSKSSLIRSMSPRRNVQRSAVTRSSIAVALPSERLSIRITSRAPPASSCHPIFDPRRLAPPTTTNLLFLIAGILVFSSPSGNRAALLPGLSLHAGSYGLRPSTQRHTGNSATLSGPAYGLHRPRRGRPDRVSDFRQRRMAFQKMVRHIAA